MVADPSRRGVNASRRGKNAQRDALPLIQRYYPAAQEAPRGIPGADYTGTPGLSIELKAYADNARALTDGVPQAERQAKPGELPVTVIRRHRKQPAEWYAVVRLQDLLEIMKLHSALSVDVGAGLRKLALDLHDLEQQDSAVRLRPKDPT